MDQINLTSHARTAQAVTTDFHDEGFTRLAPPGNRDGDGRGLGVWLTGSTLGFRDEDEDGVVVVTGSGGEATGEVVVGAVVAGAGGGGGGDSELTSDTGAGVGGLGALQYEINC